MPQMAPISWLSLFFIFSISFMIFNILNYYCFNPSFKPAEMISNNKDLNSHIKPNSLNWKW